MIAYHSISFMSYLYLPLNMRWASLVWFVMNNIVVYTGGEQNQTTPMPRTWSC